jgi:hypothetical protein
MAVLRVELICYRVQIQILLHFFLLQHPRPTPSSAEQTTTKKKRKKHGQKQQVPTNISLEARLESLMDKLAMWQLLSSIDTRKERRNQTKGKEKGKVYDDRDWMQRFCEDIVQPAYVCPHLTRTAFLLISSKGSQKHYQSFALSCILKYSNI